MEINYEDVAALGCETKKLDDKEKLIYFKNFKLENEERFTEKARELLESWIKYQEYMVRISSKA
jgi:hypothetical protein